VSPVIRRTYQGLDDGVETRLHPILPLVPLTILVRRRLNRGYQNLARS
jgi:hypothetical protein